MTAHHVGDRRSMTHDRRVVKAHFRLRNRAQSIQPGPVSDTLSPYIDRGSSLPSAPPCPGTGLRRLRIAAPPPLHPPAGDLPFCSSRFSPFLPFCKPVFTFLCTAQKRCHATVSQRSLTMIFLTMAMASPLCNCAGSAASCRRRSGPAGRAQSARSRTRTDRSCAPGAPRSSRALLDLESAADVDSGKPALTQYGLQL